MDLDARRKSVRTRLAVWLVLVALAAALIFCLSLVSGSAAIPAEKVVAILIGSDVAPSPFRAIVLNVRLPRALTAIVAGAALAMSGLLMQTVFRNPLAGPFVLGIDAGAGLGVALIMLATGTIQQGLLASLGLWGEIGRVAAASIGAAVVLLAILALAPRVQDAVALLIVGLMFGYMAGAVVTVLVYFGASESVQSFLFWSYGGYGGVTWSSLRVFSVFAAAALILGMIFVKPLNALLLGETYARTLGVNVLAARIGILVSASVLAGATTAFCGPIPFLGMAVPHIARGTLGLSDHRILAPSVCVLGAALSLAADYIAHWPGSTPLPLGAVTALMGAPIVIATVLRRPVVGA